MGTQQLSTVLDRTGPQLYSGGGRAGKTHLPVRSGTGQVGHRAEFEPARFDRSGTLHRDREER